MEIISQNVNPLQPYLDLSMLAKDNGGPKELLNQVYLQGCRDTAIAAKKHYSSLENQITNLNNEVEKLSHGNNVRDVIIAILGTTITTFVGAWVASRKDKTRDKNRKSTNSRNAEVSRTLCN